VRIAFEGGLRQFAALGFQARDYAPREWVSQLGGSYSQTLNTLGELTLMGSYRGRAVEDRPPMPLFLQPAYGNARASARFLLAPIQGVRFDVQADLDRTDYEAPRLLSHLDLLDRSSQGFEVGALTGGDRNWNVRFFSGLLWSHYKRQGGYVVDEPDVFRRDRAINLGAEWTLTPVNGGPEASLGLEGTLNRSNSLRPEYDALSLTGDFFTPLPWWGLNASASALLTWKSYVQDIPFARLVPGEEADNTSIVYVELIRGLAENLNAQLRFAWARAETDIGNSYYNRFGTTLLFNFRPGG
jgi:hypothetical protein